MSGGCKVAFFNESRGLSHNARLAVAAEARRRIAQGTRYESESREKEVCRKDTFVFSISNARSSPPPLFLMVKVRLAGGKRTGSRVGLRGRPYSHRRSRVCIVGGWVCPHFEWFGRRGEKEGRGGEEAVGGLCWGEKGRGGVDFGCAFSGICSRYRLDTLGQNSHLGTFFSHCFIASAQNRQLPLTFPWSSSYVQCTIGPPFVAISSVHGQATR